MSDMDEATIDLWLSQAERDGVLSPGFRPVLQRRMLESCEKIKQLQHAVDMYRCEGMCDHAAGKCGELCPWCEIDGLSRWVCDLQAGMYINCVYCGHQYGPDDEVAATMQDALYEHVAVCPKHPLSKANAEIERLREQLREQTRSFCTHCGKLFPKGKEGLVQFRDHIAHCNKHPLNQMAVDLAECRRLLQELLLASECFLSSEIVDETTGTIPLMDRLEKAIRAAKAGGDDE